MQLEVYEKIEYLADKMKTVKGVVGVVLFGSYSRGDYDEGSDVDLLVVFNDRNALYKGRDEVYKATSQSELFFQVVCLTVDELKGSPLLESAMREGKIYYANEDVKKLLTPIHRASNLEFLPQTLQHLQCCLCNPHGCNFAQNNHHNNLLNMYGGIPHLDSSDVHANVDVNTKR